MVVRRNRNHQLNHHDDSSDRSDNDDLPRLAAQVTNRRQRRQVGIDTRSAKGSQTRVSVTGARSRAALAGPQLSWYERLMPEFLLNMTAPLTGYESRLDSDIDDDDYEILERQRLRRNRRIRRRMLVLALVATVASVALAMRGKFVRKTGVKAVIGEMKHRLEDGLSKTIH